MPKLQLNDTEVEVVFESWQDFVMSRFESEGIHLVKSEEFDILQTEDAKSMHYSKVLVSLNNADSTSQLVCELVFSSPGSVLEEGIMNLNEANFSRVNVVNALIKTGVSWTKTRLLMKDFWRE